MAASASNSLFGCGGLTSQTMQEFVVSTTNGKKAISVRTLAACAHAVVGDSIEGFQLKRIRSGVETLLAGLPQRCSTRHRPRRPRGCGEPAKWTLWCARLGVAPADTTTPGAAPPPNSI